MKHWTDPLLFPDLTHTVGVLFDTSGLQGPSIMAVFDPSSDMTNEVLDSNAMYYWLASKLETKRDEVVYRFRNSDNVVEDFTWQFEADDLPFSEIDMDLFLALGHTKIGPTKIEVVIHRADLTLEYVDVTGSIADVYDFDYDGFPPQVRDGARVQAGYNTIGTSGRVYRTRVDMDKSVVERLMGNFHYYW